MPKVTVLTPVYNNDRYLALAIESVLTQSMRDFELLIINDGSTDRSSQIISAYALKDERIKVLNQLNQGISIALNAGLEHAGGEIIVRMDGDDIMLPSRIEKQLDVLISNSKIGICGCQYEIINAEGRALGIIKPEPKDWDSYLNLAKRREPIAFTHPTVSFYKQAVLNLGGYKKAFEPAEDKRLFGQLLLSGAHPFVIPEVLMRYRVHNESISNKKIYTQLRKALEIDHIFYFELCGSEKPRDVIGRSIAHLRSERFLLAQFFDRKASLAKAKGIVFHRIVYRALYILLLPNQISILIGSLYKRFKADK